MNEIVIFGAGSGAIKVIKTLRNLGVTITALADNDKGKWGSNIENIPVVNPEELKEKAYHIIIASDYQEEIEQQLKDMKLFHQLVLREEYILSYIKYHLEEIKTCLPLKSNSGNANTFILDLVECTAYGGIEIWSFLVGRGLKEKGKNVIFFGNRDDTKAPPDLCGQYRDIPIFYDNYWACLKKEAEEIINLLPCTIIINRQGISLMAAVAVKLLYPELLTCVSVMHTDRAVLYHRHAYLQPYIDSIAGVSSAITNNLEKKHGIPKDKLHFKESPVICNEKLPQNKPSDSRQPVIIGYGARITKTQKRADLLPELILSLEAKAINYVMNIAGDGPYLNCITKFISENNLSHKVKLLGVLEKEDMPAFWESSDIFINVSDFEGTSLSMLEAMAGGAVPVVTEVSGVSDLIIHGVNGYVIKRGEIESMSQIIAMLEKDRNQLSNAGMAARETIQKKCNIDEYLQYIEGLCRRDNANPWK